MIERLCKYILLFFPFVSNLQLGFKRSTPKHYMISWIQSLSMIELFELHYARHLVFTLCSTAAFLLIVAVAICGNNIIKAFAHETFSFGNISVAPGWEVEPPLVDQLNSIEINIIRNEAGGNSVPIRNAFSELDASIKSGGLTKTLDFEPQEESAGLYRAKILPTQVSTYSLLLIGNVDGQPINSQVKIEDVEDTTKFAFPLLESDRFSGSSQLLSGAPRQEKESVNRPGSSMQLQFQQFSPLVSDLMNQVNSTANTALRAERISEETRDTLEQVRGSIDRAYVFGMVSTGIGISGIIIGAFALTRNWDRQAILKRKQNT